MIGTNYPVEAACTEGPHKTPTLSDRLSTERERLESRLAEVVEAQAALEASPEVKAAVDAIAKLGHF